MKRRLAYPIMEDIYELPDLKEWNEEDIKKKVSNLVDSLLIDLQSDSPRFSILRSYSYGIMPVSSEIVKSISFQFLKNPRETAMSDQTILTLTYRNPIWLESKVTRGGLQIDKQTDKVNPWICFPEGIDSLEDAKRSQIFGKNVIDLLKNVFKPAFMQWALKTLKLSWANSGTDKVK